MNALFRTALTLAAATVCVQASAQVTLYEHDGFGGRSFTATGQLRDLTLYGFNDRASSVVVERNNWQVCDDAGFGGRCVVLQPGRYPSLSVLGLNDRISSLREVAQETTAAPAPTGARVTFYEREDFQGRSFTTVDAVPNFTRFDFNDRAASIVVERSNWQACEDASYGGRCVVLQPGRYPSLSGMGMTERISSVREVAQYQPAAPAPTGARVTFYEREDFQGRSFSTAEPVTNFTRFGFNDRASSIVVERDSWQVCEDVSFGGRCVVLREGRYPSLTAMGMSDRISSLRQVDSYALRGVDRRWSPAPGAATDYSRRNDEQLYEAYVTEARAVLATPQQRCWVEREQVQAPTRGDANVGGAIVGALLGGVIGHQVGAGFGKDLATIGGVVAGAAVGANVGRDRDGQPVAGQDVRRCADVPGGARPAYWDVTYRFRGVDHRMQMSQQPGATVTVNRQGEPRN